MTESDTQERLVDRHDVVDWDAGTEGFQRAVLNFDRGNIRINQDEIEGRASIHTDEDSVTLVLGNSFVENWEVATDLDPDTAEEIAEQLQFAAELARDGRKADVRT